MSTRPERFVPLARVLHWSMAIMIVAMLFIGVGMVSTVSSKHEFLLALHRPLGVVILMLAILRLVTRVRHTPPALPTDLPAWQRISARVSHWLLYAAMLAMPLIGWAMLSARGDPVRIGAMLLPPILPHNVIAAAVLREAHAWIAYALFLLVIAHVAAAMYHGLIRRDGVFSSMSGWHKAGEQRRVSPAPEHDAL